MDPHVLEHGSTVSTVDGPMLLRGPEVGAFVRSNPWFTDAVGFEDAQLAERAFLDWLHPADVEMARSVLADPQEACRVRHQTADGGFFSLDIRVTIHEGQPVVLARAVETQPEVEGPRDADDEATVIGTLHTIARIVEEENPGFKCSILLVADGRFVRGAGPSLPEEYNAAIDGFAIGPTVGSCGTAIYWNVPVVVEDIQRDVLWSPFAELAKKAGVAACWSHPFASKSGGVLGALAFYSPVPRSPTPEQLRRLRAAAKMTGMAVERGRAEAALRAQRLRELELEEQLRQAAKMEALGVLASGVAHDFNNVLNAVLGNAELASDLLPEDAEVQTMLTDIVAASRRAGQFCQQLLAYAGRGTIAGSDFDLRALMEELSSLVRVPSTLTFESDLVDEPVFVHGDEGQISQVAMNLVKNAAQAIGDAPGRIAVRLSRRSLDRAALRQMAPHARLSAGGYLCFEVEDDGPGMDAATVARIFDPFFTTKSSGHGLGLSAVQGIIGRHGGAIEIATEVGKGTTFTVVFPEVAAPSKAESVRVAPAPSKGGQVLVVDDDSSGRSVLCRRLRHSGFVVIEATDGAAAMAVLEEAGDSIGCVLVDPGHSGGSEAVLRGIRDVRQNVSIVLLSASGENHAVDPTVEVLQKPVTKDALIGAIHQAMASG